MHPNSGGEASPRASTGWQGSSLPAFSMRYPLVAVLAGALAISAFSTAWLLLQTPNFFSGYDFMRMHFFYKTYYREAILAGRLPLWNPYVGLGRPFLADIETASLYPPNLLVLPLGVYGGLALSVLLHQALAIFGGVRLGRILGAGTGPSWLVGVGIAVGSPFLSRLGVGIIEGYFTLCWLPVLLWLGARLQDGWNPRVAAALAAAVALTILAGQPPLAYVVFCGLIIFLIFRQAWPSNGPGRRDAARNAVGVAFAGTLGVGLAGAALLPFLELVREGNRPLNAHGFAIANGMPAPSWLSLIVPASEAFGPNWEYNVHCGLVPLFAALAGLFLWRDRNVRALIGLGLAGALLAAGDRAPFLGWATHFMPGAAALRIPSRYGILFATALLGLAAVALSRKPPRPAVAILAGLAVGVAWIVWLEPHVVGASGNPVEYYATHVGALCAAALLVALWFERSRWPRVGGPIGLALVIFCAANWLLAMSLQSPVYSQYGFHTDDAAVRSALDKAGLTAAVAPARVSFNAADVRENAGMVQGFSGYDSYVAPSLRRTWGYLHSASGVPMSAADFIRLPEAVGERSDRLDGINLVADFDRLSQSVSIRRDPDPRAYMVFEREVVADWKEAEGKMASRREFHKKALVEEGLSPLLFSESSVHEGTASITSFAPERVVVGTHSNSRGYLVLAEAWYPGWRASVNGMPSEVFPINGWMRGVIVPAGQNEVTFTFHSRLLPAGLAVSLASAAIVVGLVLGRRRSG
jgi:hypothetical protein